VALTTSLSAPAVFAVERSALPSLVIALTTIPSYNYTEASSIPVVSTTIERVTTPDHRIPR
jgi:hypothetical protein